MMKRGLWISVLFLSLPFGSTAANDGPWQNLTSMREVRAITRIGSTLWAATAGGAFGMQGDGSFVKVTTAQGLTTNDLTAIAGDAAGTVWIGSADGMLQSFTPASGGVRTYGYIADTQERNKRITMLSSRGDTLFVGTAFGLSIFRISKQEFGDTYRQFGSVSSTTSYAVTSVVLNANRIWVSVSSGQALNLVASADVNAPNLSLPTAWTVEAVGIPGSALRRLVIAFQRLYAVTSTGLFVRDAGTWTPVAGVEGQNLVDAAAAPDTLFTVSATNEILSIGPSHTVARRGPLLPAAGTALMLNAQQQPVVGTALSGLLLPPEWTSSFPDGPGSNQISNVIVDPDGVVWGASGPLSGQGLYRFDGKSWQTLTTANSALPMNEVYRVSVGCNGALWASMWGGGIAEIPAGGSQIDSAHVYGYAQGMVGIATAPTFVVTSNTVCDGNGNQWTSIVEPANRRVLAVRTSNGTWRTLPVILQQRGVQLSSLVNNSTERSLALDANDNLWATVRDPAYQGVICLRNRGAVDSVAEVHLTAENGLPGNEARTIVVDRDNTVWVGTDKGIGLIVDPDNPTRDKAIAAYKPLFGLVVNAIAIDPLNQKWVGTNAGVILLSPDGTQELASYTVENTGGKLMDNEVRSIAIDGRTGTVYFATGGGLSSLATTAAAPRASFDELRVYPNPFRLPAERLLTVDGLMENSRLKVLATDGTLVRELTTPGGRIGFWDGKDSNGNDVASGIYLIVAYQAEGQKAATAKVAVIRR